MDGILGTVQSDGHVIELKDQGIDNSIENIFSLTVLVLVLAVLLLFLARKGKCVKKKIINFKLTLPFRRTRPC